MEEVSWQAPEQMRCGLVDLFLPSDWDVSDFPISSYLAGKLAISTDRTQQPLGPASVDAAIPRYLDPADSEIIPAVTGFEGSGEGRSSSSGDVQTPSSRPAPGYVVV